MKGKSFVGRAVLSRLFLIGFVSGLVFSSCSNDKSDDIVKVPDEPADSTYPPVETAPPNTSYSPAFSGQTRVAGVRTKTNYIVTQFASGLSSPWGLTSLPDGRLIVTEKNGTLRIVSASGSLSAPINGLPAVNSSGQGGLLDIAVDPNFSSNRMLYWTFAQSGQGGTATAVAKGRLSLDETTIENPEVIYTALPRFNGTLHYGSRLEWDKDGNLFVSTGERSSMQTRAEAQNVKNGLGKIVRITTSGTPAMGNPTFTDPDAIPELYSYGHRNVQGLATHPATGDLWSAEFGPKGGDEVNLIKPGNNYGWPVITYGIEYSGATIGQGITQQSGMEQPVYYWDPVISPSGITFYSGNLINEWTNNLFLAGLSGQHVVRLVIKDNKVVGEERLLSDEKQRFRDIHEGLDGALYTITDSGLLYRIAP